MSGQVLKILVGGMALAAMMPLPLAAGISTVPGNALGSADFQQKILQSHNQERSRVGVAPMRWNAGLAASAQGWADRLAATGRFEHAPEDPRAPMGENLWAGTPGYFRPEAMVDAWVREKRYFRPGVFPNNSTTGRVEDVGHYTQLIWRSTVEVGCARATGPREEVLVCRYAEPGNYRGERPL